MPIDFRCTGCSQKVRAPDKFAGRKVKCPKCATVLEIPAKSDSAVTGASGAAAVDQSASDKPLAGGSADDAAQDDIRAAGPLVRDSQEVVPAAPLDDTEADRDEWYVRTEEGDEYGPVTKADLDSWVEEERVDGQCQILKKHWDDWKSADAVYPELAEEEAGENPFAGIAASEAPSAEPGPRFGGDSDIDGEVLDEEPVGTGSSVTSGSVTGGSQLGIERVLTESRPWVQIMAVFGFLTGGVWAIGCIYYFILATSNMAVLGMTLSLIAVAGPALLILGSYFLYVYSQKIRVFERTGGARDLQGAIAAQRAFWKLAGIVSAIVLGVYGLLALTVALAKVLGFGVFGPA